MNEIKNDRFVIPNEFVGAMAPTNKFIFPNELHNYILKYSSCRCIRIFHSLNNNLFRIYPYSFGYKLRFHTKITHHLLRGNIYLIYHIRYGKIKNVAKSISENGIFEIPILYDEKGRYATVHYDGEYDRRSYSSMWLSCYEFNHKTRLYALTYLPIVLSTLMYKNNKKYNYKRQINIKLFKPIIYFLIEKYLFKCIKKNLECVQNYGDFLKSKKINFKLENDDYYYDLNDIESIFELTGNYFYRKGKLNHIIHKKRIFKQIISFCNICTDPGYYTIKFLSKKDQYTICKYDDRIEYLRFKDKKDRLISHFFYE